MKQQDIARLIGEYREASGLSMRDFGDLCNVPSSTIHAIEHGANNMTLGTLVKILAAMKLKLRIVDDN